jgi:hypothetical protein
VLRAADAAALEGDLPCVRSLIAAAMREIERGNVGQ